MGEKAIADQVSAKTEGINYALEVEFTNSEGETLNLLEIKERAITSVTFRYLEKARVRMHVRLPWYSYTSFHKQEEKVFTVSDCGSILLGYAPETRGINLRFSDLATFERLEDYDDAVIHKRRILTHVGPYQFSFHAGNIQSIDWE
jgi:hypothetical protein